jgi:localization factor PodJL
MATQATWQTGSANKAGDRDAPLSEAPLEQRSIEGLLRGLVERVEEEERRYSEALDELHAWLGQLSHTTGTASTDGSPEEAETLARLHSEVSQLAKRLEQGEPSDPECDDFAEIGKALSDTRPLALSVPEGSDAAKAPEAAWAKPEDASADASSPKAHDHGAAAPSFSLPPFESEDADLDKRLIATAHRLEQSIDAVMPAAVIDGLNAKMDEMAARFESALSGTPKIDHLNRLERQISDMGQQLSRAEQDLARIGGIEDHLLRLIRRVEETPPEIEQMASKAANEAARLVSDTAKAGAAQRLDAIHRDLVAMNERGAATDNRLVDTLGAVHESLKQLVVQVERGPQIPAPAPLPSFAERIAASEPPASRVGVAPRADRPTTDEAEGETRPDAQERERSVGGEQGSQPNQRLLRARLGAAVPDSEDRASPASLERYWRSRLKEGPMEIDEAGSSSPSPAPAGGADEQASLATDDETATATSLAKRFAPEAPAAPDERSGRSWSHKAHAATRVKPDFSSDPQARHTRPALIIVAAVLLVISAALLYGRLHLKSNIDSAPQATEQNTGSQEAPVAESTQEYKAPADTEPETATPAPTQSHGTQPPARSGWETILPSMRFGQSRY